MNGHTRACTNCGHIGAGVAWWPWHVARGIWTPHCADELLCAQRWNELHWPEGNEPGGAVDDALAARARAA